MVKNPPANAGDSRDASLIPGSEDLLEEEIAPLQYSRWVHYIRSEEEERGKTTHGSPL